MSIQHSKVNIDVFANDFTDLRFVVTNHEHFTTLKIHTTMATSAPSVTVFLYGEHKDIMEHLREALAHITETNA